MDLFPLGRLLTPDYYSEDGRVAQHMFDHDDGEGRQVHLSYVVEHADDSKVHALDEVEEVVGIHMVRQLAGQVRGHESPKGNGESINLCACNARDSLIPSGFPPAFLPPPLTPSPLTSVPPAYSSSGLLWQTDSGEDVHEVALHFTSKEAALQWHTQLRTAEQKHQFLSMGRQWGVVDPHTDKVSVRLSGRGPHASIPSQQMQKRWG